MKKTLPAIVVVLQVVLAIWCAVGVATGNIQLNTSNQEQEQDTPDCDADDKIGKWDTADCGPSPVPVVRRTPAVPLPRKTK